MRELIRNTLGILTGLAGLSLAVYSLGVGISVQRWYSVLGGIVGAAFVLGLGCYLMNKISDTFMR